ncbi:phage tail protein [Symbiopectobacterium purcellii]|uniref:phage tail protein n=1 Tax=Symbiopectobacterium purcellii TaxID=2871826 RepID=UPI003F85D489
MRYREFVLSPYGVIKIKSLGYNGDLDALKTGLISALSKNVSNTVPAASTTVAGITKLSSATNSNDETMAATPKAVKAANDNANGRVPSGRTVNGKALSADITLGAGDVGAYSKQEIDTALNSKVAGVKQTGPFDATAGALLINGAWGWGGSGYNQVWTAETFLTWARNAANGSRVFRNDTPTPYSKRYGSGVFMRAGDTWSLISVGAIAGGPDVNGVRISSGNNSGSETQSYELWTNQNLPNPISASEFAGIPLPFPGAVAPPGFLTCNGQAFNKTTYPILAELYPSGHLPDLRGEFIRGADDGRGVDAGRALLSAQGDAMQPITAKWTMNDMTADKFVNYPPAGALYIDRTALVNFDATSTRTNTGARAVFDSSRQTRTANETRPRNIAFNYIVRAA